MKLLRFITFLIFKRLYNIIFLDKSLNSGFSFLFIFEVTLLSGIIVPHLLFRITLLFIEPNVLIIQGLCHFSHHEVARAVQ